jgi:hypothetical protein
MLAALHMDALAAHNDETVVVPDEDQLRSLEPLPT